VQVKERPESPLFSVGGLRMPQNLRAAARSNMAGKATLGPKSSSGVVICLVLVVFVVALVTKAVCSFRNSLAVGSWQLASNP
jgi:hypothetical protein